MIKYKVDAFGSLENKGKFVTLMKVGNIYLKGELYELMIKYRNLQKNVERN